MIDSLSTDLTGQIDVVHVEFMAKVELLSVNYASQQACLTSLEHATNTYSDRDVNRETQVANLDHKAEDLVGRQCQCNIQILGITEKFKADSCPANTVAKFWPNSGSTQHQHYQEKLEVLQRAARVSPLTYINDKLMI